MSLEVKGQYGLLFLSCLLITVVQQPGTSSLPSLLKCSSVGCHLDVQCMRPSPNCITFCSLPRSTTVVFTQWTMGGGFPRVYICSTTANFYVIPFRHRHPGFPSVSSSVSIWSPQCRPRWPQLQGIRYRYTTLDYISKGNVSLSFINIDVCLMLPVNPPDVLTYSGHVGYHYITVVPLLLLSPITAACV